MTFAETPLLPAPKLEYRECRHHQIRMPFPHQNCPDCERAGYEMTDIRDIVAQCDRDVPEQIAAIVRGFGLRNYRGPVIAIRVSGPEAKLEVYFRVRDTTTGDHQTLTVFSGHLADEGRFEERIGHRIRAALHYTVTHEIDECLLYRGEFVHHPHPEREQAVAVKLTRTEYAVPL